MEWATNLGAILTLIGYAVISCIKWDRKNEQGKSQSQCSNDDEGASSWLTTIPLQSENFALTKREFFDAISLHYRWHVKYMPSTCPCGKQYNIDNAMSCLKGGFIHHCHDDMRDTLAKLLDESRIDVSIESHLKPLTGEQLPASSIEDN